MIELAVMCLAMNVYWESRDQSIAGQVAVAQVTMNRVESPNFPNDVCSVVHQHKQFSWYWDGKSDVPREEDAWMRAQMVAKGVLAGSGHVGLEGVLQADPADYSVDLNTGDVTMVVAPASTGGTGPGGAETLSAECEYDVPVRFDTDKFNISLEQIKAGAIPSMRIVEIRIA